MRAAGALNDAVTLLEDAMLRAQRLGERRLLGEFTMQMGWVRIGLNQIAQSRGLFERAFSDKSDDRDRYGVCCARHGLATVALKEERLSDALDEFLATLDAAMDLQLKDYIARAFHGIAAVEAMSANSISRSGCWAWPTASLKRAAGSCATALPTMLPKPRSNRFPRIAAPHSSMKARA